MVESISVDINNEYYTSRDKNGVECNVLIRKSDNVVFGACSSSVLPEGVVALEEDLYAYHHNVETIVIPSTVTNIGNYAFAWCKILTSITFLNETPATLGRSYEYGQFKPYWENPPQLTIYVPAGSVNAYKTAAGWSEYADLIQAIPQQ